MVTILACLWFQFPAEWRMNVAFSKRFIYFVMNQCYGTMMNLSYIIVGIGFELVHSKYQWIMAIVCLIVRELHNFVYAKISQKAAYREDLKVKTASSHLVACTHACVIALLIGSKANETTAYLLLTIDFAINMFLTCQIIYYRKKDEDAAIDAIQTLVLNETVEFVIPLAFLCNFCIAYYGPNAEVLGGIKNSYWHFVAVSDVWMFSKNILLMFVIDAASLIISGLALKIFCNVSILKVYFRMQKDIGIFMAVTQVATINSVCYYISAHQQLFKSHIQGTLQNE